MKNLLFTLVLLLCPFIINAQEVTETNTDILYQKALEHYKNEEYQKSLQLTNRGLELAPKYHDIRILQIRNLWAVNELSKADDELEYLLTEAPEYADLKPLVYRRINLFTNNTGALDYLKMAEIIYPADKGLQVKKAQLLIAEGERKKAREIAMNLISSEGLTGAERYDLQIILNRSVSDEIGFTYQFINFSKDYSRTDPWHTISAEYQHNFDRTAVIGRVNYSNRGYDDAALYELEAYPVFNDRLYAFTNIGFSNGTIFPDLRSSLSLFYNFASVFEAEAGGLITRL
ncbi:YaiO family outer membrane beta-barrel protein [Antarcticibacterium sp. 1MA-6-2]|uniref:YaiO family outer membrane beta-barrel protein n=1 Tax=Antarcticibacterium sp. 1MA-6-2 TaxID=2908210 RepID=UPI002104A467|nr:YaiO family outer membrane beta-barrel protein [Antarcticibacterium sp. 1MA-6-2]